MKIIRKGTTFGLIFWKKKRMYVFQFTFKEPWWIPKCDRNYGKRKDIVLYGWLFFYFGYTDFGGTHERERKTKTFI